MRFPIKSDLALKALLRAVVLSVAIISSFLLKAVSANNNYGAYPEPDHGYITDLADLLDSKEEELIEQWLWQVEAREGIEMAVVTVNSISDYPGTDNQSIESFARGLFNQYGIGNLPKNDGILFLIAKKDRKARIELGAYYGFSKNIDTERIMARVIIPEFQKGEYSHGLTAGVKALMWEFARMYPLTWAHIILFLSIICFLALLAYNLFKQGKKGWGWFVIAILVAIIIWIIHILLKIFKYMAKDSSEHWEPGGWGGGFGGGSSGGGGATGSW